MNPILPIDTLRRAWIDRMETEVPIKLSGKEFTADDLHDHLDPPDHDNWWGALMARLRNKDRLIKVGYRISKRPEANGRTVSVWRIK